MNKETTIWDRFNEKFIALGKNLTKQDLERLADIEPFFRQEILELLKRLDMKTLRDDLETSRDKYTYNSAVRLLKDKIKKEKQLLK